MTACIAAAVLMTACGESGKDAGEQGAEESYTPVTLKFYTGNVDYEERFRAEIASKVTQKYPHISFEYQGAEKGKEIHDLVVAGDSPDIYYQGLSALENNLIKHNLQLDVEPLVKKHQFDTDRIEGVYMDLIRNASASYGGSYYGLPVTAYTPVLYYNKEIFEKFAVPYPRDDMSWDEVYAIAQKIQRVEEGVQYRGLTMNFVYIMENNQLGAPFFHPSKDESDVNNDQWKSIFTTLGRFFQLPLEQPIDKRSRVKEVGLFVDERTSAMHADVTAAMENFPDDFVQWDIVSFPWMNEASHTNAQVNPRFYYLMGSGKHQDDAFRVLEVVLSDEVQMEASRRGTATVLNNKEIQDAFGSQAAHLQGKNVGALYVNPPVAVSPPRDAKLTKVPTTSYMNDSFNEFIANVKDVNTALRDFQEGVNKAIAEQKAAQ